jgi:autotransporter-associated beta strand protein
MRILCHQIRWPLSAAVLFACATLATAQTTQYWDPALTGSSSGGGAGTWSSAANWFNGTSDTVWTNDNFAVFGNDGGAVTLGAAQKARGLTFGVDGYVLNGATLTLDGAPRITVPAYGTATINAVIAGSAGLTVLTNDGPGALVLGAANTYTGGTAVGASSTLQLNGVGVISGAIALGSPAANLVVTNRVNGAILTNTISGDSSTSVQVMSIPAGGANTFINSELTNFYGTIYIYPSGANFTGINTAAPFHMPTNAGGWNIAVNAQMYIAGGFTIAAPVTINGPGSAYGALRFDSGTISGPVNLAGGNNQIGGAGSGTVTISGVISGNDLNRWGGGSTPVGSILKLSGQNTYTGSTTLSYGRLQVASAENPGVSGPLGANPQATIYFSPQSPPKWDGGMLQYSSTNNYDYSGRFSTDDNQQYKIDVYGQNVSFASPLTSSGGTFLLIDDSTAGNGTLTFNAANAYTSGTTISNGTLVANVAGAIPGPATVAGGTLIANAAGAVAGPVTVYNSGALVAAAGGSVQGNITVSSTKATLTLRNASALSTSATLTLPAGPAANSVSNNFTGTQTIGLMYFGGLPQAGGTWGAPGSGAVNQSVVFTGTGLLNVAPPPPVATAYWDPGARKASPGSGGSGTWNSTLANWWTNGSSDTTWPSGDVATFAGTAGTVTLGDNEAAPGLAFNTPGYILTNSSGAVLTLSGVANVLLAGGNATIGCPIAGTAGLTESSAGMLVLSATNTYTGPTTLYGGLTIAGAGQLGSGNYLDNIADLGTLIYHSSATQTLAGVISDSGMGGTLVQEGPGLLVLGGANTYSGATTVTNGCALQINNVAGAGSGPLALGTNSVLIISNRVSNAAIANAITGDSTTVISVTTPGFNTYINGNMSGFYGQIVLNTLGGNLIGVNTAAGASMPSSAVGWNVPANAEMYIAGGVTIVAPITINGPGPSGYGAIRLDSGTIAGPVLLNGAGTNNQIGGAGGGVVTISGVISDNGAGNGLSRWGGGSTPAGSVLALTGQNTYGGPTTLSYGELQVASPEHPGISGPLGRSNALSTIYFSAQPNAGANGGALQYSGTNQYDYSSRFSSAPGQKYKIDANGQKVTFASPLTSSGGTFLLFDSVGGGTLTLNAANTYDGGTTVAGGTLEVGSGSIVGAVTVNGGTLQLDNPASLSPDAILTLASGVTVNLNYGGTQTIYALFIGGIQQPNGVYGASVNPSGIFTGPGTLTVLGASPPTISSAAINATHQLVITWRSVPGASYNVYSTTNLSSQPINWTLETSSPILAAAATTSFTLPESVLVQRRLFVAIGQ